MSMNTPTMGSMFQSLGSALNSQSAQSGYGTNPGIDANPNPSVMYGTAGQTATGSNPFAGVTPTDYSSVKANSTYMPGLGYIPNSEIQSDSRGSWIGAGPGAGANTSNPMSDSFSMPSAPTLSSSYGNPYQNSMDAAITKPFNDTLMNDWLPSIQSQSVATGGLGGSRQGIAQGLAIGQAGTGLANALAQSHYGQFNQDQNRNLQAYGMNQNYNLGLGGLNLGYQNTRNSFYNAQRGLDQSGAALGANLYNLGQQGQWSPYQNFTGTLSPWSGFGSTTGTTSQGGGTQGLLGGGLSAAAMGHLMGWW
jgi:hypothetical protein